MLPSYDDSNNHILVPPTHIRGKRIAVDTEITVCYMMLLYGYTLTEIKNLRDIPKDWTMAYIQNRYDIKGYKGLPKSFFGELKVENESGVRKLAI